MGEEPGVDVGELEDFLDGAAHFEGVADVVEAALGGDGEFAVEFFFGDGPGGGGLFFGVFAGHVGAAVAEGF